MVVVGGCPRSGSQEEGDESPCSLAVAQLHPLGHGRELYFWSFIVTLLILALGAGVSMYEGIARSTSGAPIRRWS